MHILILNWQDRTHPQAGGAEVHLHEIFGRIAAMGHRVTLFCCRYDGAAGRETIDGIDVIRQGSRQTFNYVVPRWYKANIDVLQPDIVIDDINKIPFFAPRFVHRPLLAIIHHFFGSTIFQEAGRLQGAYVKYFEDKIGKVYASTPICTVSESTRRECIERGLDASHVRVIHNAIDQHAFPMRVGVKEADPTIAYFGRLKKYKSVDHLIRAFAVLRSRLPKARLHILGTGDHRPALEALARELGVADAVTFFGYVSEVDKVRLLSAAHVVVNTSVKEGWGITNIEANACGTPVVSADVPGLRDSVRAGESGQLYPYGDVDALAGIVTRILIDDQERRRLSDGAVAWASTFTWARSAREMLDLCTNVINTWHA